MRIPFLGGIGVLELIIILVVVLLIFGPKNLPKLGNALGKTVKSMRDGMDGKKKKDTEASDKAEDVPVESVTDEEGAESEELDEPAADASEEPAEKATASKED